MDEGFETLQQRGPTYELTPWYADGPPAISDICFFSGSEEICILEQSGRIRVFSLLVQAFRPGSIWLSPSPVKIQSSPDGAALLVWERFPVIPAIARDFTTDLPSMKITFIHPGEPGSLQRIPRYFRSMIRDFISRCQKPTDGKLDEIEVQVKSVMDAQGTTSDTHAVSSGQWFVELICLIPVHIAVARDNRFVPLKDGMSSDGLGHRLLGSEVAEIIDEITLGPYEAILGSYMAAKPVRVVSSMGEQSVGKSFSLNHLIDTSFAGSAMRTTEGVWLSLCPTKDQVVIALDFEGVHSLERTAQEDMLLVLFNAAISNLVMFRNNFAFSRNVANMFTSFQAGTRQFDPEHNPTLFKGLLAIIIKDVVDADKTEIVEEFRSKFNEIVRREQGENFITILHDNQLAVMPWDVIQSNGFYTRFKRLSKHLFKQPRTHENAGEFLFTLKTLMAKLTAQDWGAIDNTLIKHRTSAMQVSLEQALVSGQGDMGPNDEWEALKNYDTQQVLECQDTDAIFYLGSTDDGRQERLNKLLERFGPEPARSSTADLQAYLQEAAMLRIHHVRKWVDSNLARFMPSDNADIKALQRQVDDLTTVMVANLQLCLNKCGSCQLRCLRPKAHLAGDHDCGTSVSENQGDARICYLPAGHDGCHIHASSRKSHCVMEAPSLAKIHACCHSTKTIPDTPAAMTGRAPCDANCVHDIARWETTFTELALEPSTSAGKNTLADNHANLLGHAKLYRSRNR
ncbi:hypothetical protein FRC01_008173 [Tulasnella sp. 417]|nr:hypothetical protein FRC01_008173 [Tulasnella sp. 417]